MAAASKSYVDEELAKLSRMLQADLAEVKAQIRNLQLKVSNNNRGNNNLGSNNVGPLVSVA